MPGRLTPRRGRRAPAPALAAAALAAGAMSVLAACAAIGGGEAGNPDYDPSKPHHRPWGFENRHLPGREKEGFWRWQWERWRDDLPPPPAAPIKGVAPDLARIAAPGAPTQVTWIGHATLLVQVDGLNILTDPHFGQRASPVSFAGPPRHQPPGVALAQLPPIDAVLISHNHYDHLDLDSVRALMARDRGRVRFFVPLGVQHWFARHVEGSTVGGASANVVALDWDQRAVLRGRSGAEVGLHFLAVQHWSSRTPWDRQRTLWGSWAVLHPQWRFWFSGDLGYSPDTAAIGRAHAPFDLAAIAIGAYAPRWFMQPSHIDPAEAVQVMQDVGARRAIGIHWGTFEGLTDEPLDEPPRELARAVAARQPAVDFGVLRHGETVSGR